jgi:hypothetical protein
MRQCKKCGQSKSEDCFYVYKKRSGKIGPRFECIECYLKNSHDRYMARPYSKWPQGVKDKHNRWSVAYNQKSRDMVFDHYGRQCACCGERERIFLTIDHVNNDGNKHRKVIGTTRLYKWLVDNGYPSNFQILCRNCNWAKHANGGICPHQSQKVQRLERKLVASSDAKREAPENWGGDIVCSYM